MNSYSKQHLRKLILEVSYNNKNVVMTYHDLQDIVLPKLKKIKGCGRSEYTWRQIAAILKEYPVERLGNRRFLFR